MSLSRSVSTYALTSTMFGLLMTIACGSGAGDVIPAPSGAGGTGESSGYPTMGGTAHSAAGGAIGAAGGTATGLGGTSQTGSADCSGITDAGYELCDSNPGSCTAVFRNREGCTTVCAAAGLSCISASENLGDACAPDPNLPPVECDSGSRSDFCECG